jgi:hypothetical protein
LNVLKLLNEAMEINVVVLVEELLGDGGDLHVHGRRTVGLTVGLIVGRTTGTTGATGGWLLLSELGGA